MKQKALLWAALLARPLGCGLPPCIWYEVAPGGREPVRSLLAGAEWTIEILEPITAEFAVGLFATSSSRTVLHYHEIKTRALQPPDDFNLSWAHNDPINPNGVAIDVSACREALDAAVHKAYLAGKRGAVLPWDELT